MEVIEAALEMLKFSMGNTLVMFREKCYEYGVDDDPMNRSLTIGGYNSAWNADLIASYLLDLSQDHFTETKLFGLYRDDGNIVFDGTWSTEEIQSWLHSFQTKVNQITNSDDIQFTMDIWRPGETNRTIVPKLINVIGSPTFPYLDMNLKFDEENML